MRLHRALVATPIGPMLALASDEGLCALEFDGPARHERLAARLKRWFPPHEIVDRDAPPIGAARVWLTAYFGGASADAAAIPLDLRGAPFELRVWERLRAIPAGATSTYGAIATELGAPGASRAVGAANGANPVGIIVPCHRVIGSSGKLTGFAGGLEVKARLLALEARK
jgi:O-6-methylguanine DNA methyltransferase